MAKDVVAVHHCLLNPAVRAEGASEFSGVVKKIRRRTQGCHVIQIPCPELIYAGFPRPPKTKEDYDNPEFRDLCAKLAQELKAKVDLLEKKGMRLKEIIGVDSSPSCGVFKVHTVEGKIEGSGILVEEIRKLLSKVKYRTYQELT